MFTVMIQFNVQGTKLTFVSSREVLIGGGEAVKGGALKGE